MVRMASAILKDSEKKRFLDRIRAVTFREARDAGAAFITCSWVALKLKRSEDFVKRNWRKSIDDCETEFRGGRPEQLSQESKSIVIQASRPRKKSCSGVAKEILVHRNKQDEEVEEEKFFPEVLIKEDNLEFEEADLDSMFQNEELEEEKIFPEVFIKEESFDFEDGDLVTKNEELEGERIFHEVFIKEGSYEFEGVDLDTKNEDDFLDSSETSFESKTCSTGNESSKALSILSQDYNSKRYLKTPMKEKPFKCDECSYTAFRRSRVIRHSRTHTGERPFKCTFCSYRASRKDQAMEHSRTHTGEKPFQCTECPFSSSRKTTVIRHARKAHTIERPYTCTECSYSATRKNELIRHTKIHTGEKPFKCTECSYRAARNSMIVRHTRIHTGEKPFICTECSYSSFVKSNLTRHMETHTKKTTKQNKKNLKKVKS